MELSVSTFSSKSRSKRRFLPASALAALLLGGTPACTPDACLRQSDCAPTFMCSSGSCVPDAVDGGATADASARDAGRVDAGTDAAVPDLGMADGGANDAARSDGGMVDADVDAAL